MNLKKTYLLTFYIILLFGLLTTGMLLNGCKGKSSYKLTGDTLVDGKNLVQINCTKCHALVPFDALNKNVWKHHALPSMAPYLGLTAYLGGYYKDEKDTSGLDLNSWQNIVSYYQKIAPDSLAPAKKPAGVELLHDWAGFTLKAPAPLKQNCFTTMVAVNPNNHKIYTSDEETKKITEWDSHFNMKEMATLLSPAVNAIFSKDAAGVNQAFFTSIGRMDRADFPNGRVLQFDLDSKNNNQTVVAEDLARPVQSTQGDFNKDGLADLLILGQGYLKGGVYLFTQNKDHSYKQTTITEKPGAVQAIVGDFNNDGWPDAMILYGSGDEGVWMYLNDHKGGFTSKKPDALSTGLWINQYSAGGY